MTETNDNSSGITALKKNEIQVYWTASKCILDHVQILLHLPYFFLAPLLLMPKQAEASHLSQNFVNSCPYCRMLHGELGRMAGLSETYKLNDLGQIHPDDVKEVSLFAMFGSSFKATNGANSEVLDKIQGEIQAEYGRSVAKATRGLSFFLLWGRMSGNTINNFLFETMGKFKAGSNTLFELIFVLWYGPLFFIIVIVSTLFKAMPRVPRIIWILLSLVLATVASLWIIPFSLVCLLLSPVANVFSKTEKAKDEKQD
jgi:hypothetical protein